jgi:hypothetical protein
VTAHLFSKIKSIEFIFLSKGESYWSMGSRLKDQPVLNDINAVVAEGKTWREVVILVLQFVPLNVEFNRQWLLRRRLKRIVQLTGSAGKTPDQTLSRVLQGIRDEGYLKFKGDGVYVLTEYPELNNVKKLSKYRGERIVARILDSFFENSSRDWFENKKIKEQKIKALQIEKKKKGQKLTYEGAKKLLGYNVSEAETQLRECHYIAKTNLQGLNYVQQATLEGLKKERSLRLDFLFFIKKNKRKQWFAIEFQGEQHRIAVKHWGGETGLLYRRECDQIKANYCINHQIILICVQSYKYKIVRSQIQSVISYFESPGFDLEINSRLKYYWNFDDLKRLEV